VKTDDDAGTTSRECFETYLRRSLGTVLEVAKCSARVSRPLDRLCPSPGEDLAGQDFIDFHVLDIIIPFIFIVTIIFVISVVPIIFVILVIIVILILVFI